MTPGLLSELASDSYEIYEVYEIYEINVFEGGKIILTCGQL